MNIRQTHIVGLLVLSTLLLTIANGRIGEAKPQNDARPVADNPRAYEVLPESTVLYLQIDNVANLRNTFENSAMGQMIQDEKMAPFVGGMTDVVREAYQEDAQEKTGLEFERLLNIPQGEICFAVIPQRRADAAFILMVGVDEDDPASQQFVDHLINNTDDELEIEESVEGQFKLKSISATRPTAEGASGEQQPDEEFFYARGPGICILSNQADVLKGILDRFNGDDVGDEASLAENRKFSTVMRRCGGDGETPPDLSFFVDPIELIRATNRSNVGVKTALAFLPYVGVDGLLAVGGSLTYGVGDFDTVFHGHLLLASPRKGFLNAVALKPGINEPESFVPQDVATYTTINLDFSKTWDEVEAIYDTFTSEGKFAQAVEQDINEKLDIDLRTDVFDHLDGRATVFSWIQPSAGVNNTTHAVALKIRSPEAFEPTFTKLREFLIDSNPDAISEHRSNGITYWRTSEERLERRRERRAERRERRRERGDDAPEFNSFREPVVCLAMLEDYLIVADSEQFFEKIVRTHRGLDIPLVGDEQYMQVMRQIEAAAGTSVPAMTYFSRPELQVKNLFELAQNKDVKRMLDDGAENENAVRQIRNVFEDSPLPPFEDVAKYFPPAGALVVDDETGIHLTAFTLKVKSE